MPPTVAPSSMLLAERWSSEHDLSFGLNSAGAGFNQGTCKLEIGAIDTVKAISVGNATNSMDYTVGTGGTWI